MGETARTLDPPPSPGTCAHPPLPEPRPYDALMMPSTHPGRAWVARAVVTTACQTGSLNLGPWADVSLKEEMKIPNFREYETPVLDQVSKKRAFPDLWRAPNLDIPVGVGASLRIFLFQVNLTPLKTFAFWWTPAKLWQRFIFLFLTL